MIAVLTDPSSGGTFLTWSLYYLSGQSEYYAVRKQEKIKLVSDPITATNAHGFCANQPTTLKQSIDQINLLSNRSAEEFNVLYFHNLRDCNNQSDSITGIAINKTIEQFKKIICLTISPKNSLYQCTYNKRVITRNHQNNQLFSNYQEQHENFIQTFFGESQKIWAQQGLCEIWDQREFLALNTRPFESFRIVNAHNFNFDHYYIDSMDLWTQFDLTVFKLFKYLEIDIDLSRWDHWLKIYTKWKKIHYQRIQFVMYFDTIIDYILQGKSMDLEQFDLDIMQESAIQQALIYNHNHNLKTWQLDKFLNTQQLHALLETNIHPLH